MNREEMKEIRQGLKEISEGKVIPLDVLEMREQMKLTPTQIGDNLNLEIEGEYPCSDGGKTTTISVDKLLEAQLDKCLSLLSSEELREKIARLLFELHKKHCRRIMDWNITGEWGSLNSYDRNAYRACANTILRTSLFPPLLKEEEIMDGETKKPKFKDLPVFGIWKDREDIDDE